MAQPQHTILPVVSVFLVVCHCISAAAPGSLPPAVDCSSLVLTMADCLSFVSNGSTVEKPEGTCCSGLKDVLKTDAECLCDAFRSSAQLGVILNVTKALALPAACKVPAASVNKCDLSIAPASSPVLSPESSPSADEASSAPSSTAPAAADEVSAPVPTRSLGVTSGSSEIIASMWLLMSYVAVAVLLF